MKVQKFGEISKPEFHNRKITIKCVIAGKSLAPYRIPKVVEISNAQNGEKEKYTISAKDEKILYFIDIKSSSMQTAIRQVLGIQYKKFDFEILEVQYIDRIFFHQVVGEEKSKEYQTRMGYYIGESLEVNRRYKLNGYSTIDPSNQTVTYVFTKFQKLQSDIESFNIKHEISDLKKFQVEKPTAERIFYHLDKLYKSYAHNITKIYYRMDLHLAIDLVFHSTLQFKFGDELVKKGWMDIMVVGDTRCGKGYVAEGLVNYYGLGEVVSAENSSFAGIVAGLEQYQKHWTVKWGKLPMNDCGLLVIDEASNLGETWSMLSRIRSEGVAEVTKIHTQVTNARTRLIFLTNPILKTISNYSYGIQSLLDIVKSPEDIARFDYALVVAHNEVELEKINKSKHLMPYMYERSLEKKLILWTWGRTGDQIIFTKEAIEKTYKYAILLGKEYDFTIPLIQGENIRIKLARIAIAFASRCFNASKDGTRLIVNSVFIECAYVFLNIIYKKGSSGYFTYSKAKLSNEEMKNNLKLIEAYLDKWRNKEGVMRCLLLSNNIVLRDFMEYLNQPYEASNEVLSMLLRHNCLTKKFNYYVKTPIFTNWLKEQLFGTSLGIENEK